MLMCIAAIGNRVQGAVYDCSSDREVVRKGEDTWVMLANYDKRRYHGVEWWGMGWWKRSVLLPVLFF